MSFENVFSIIGGIVLAFLSVFFPCKVQLHCNYIRVGDTTLPDIEGIAACLGEQFDRSHTRALMPDVVSLNEMKEQQARIRIINTYTKLSTLIAEEEQLCRKYNDMNDNHLWAMVFIPLLYVISDFSASNPNLFLVSSFFVSLILFLLLFWRFPRLYRWECPPYLSYEEIFEVPELKKPYKLLDLAAFLETRYSQLSKPLRANIYQMETAITRSKHYSVAAAVFIGILIGCIISGV